MARCGGGKGGPYRKPQAPKIKLFFDDSQNYIYFREPGGFLYAN